MDNKIKRDSSLTKLLLEYEYKFENGDLGFFDEKIYIQLIEYYESEYMFEKAIEVANHAINQYQYRSEFLLIKARLLFNLGLYEDCLEALDNLELVAPYEREIFLIRAKTFAIKKQFEAAQFILDSMSSGSTPSELCDLLVTESYIHEYKKDFDAMFECLAKAVKAHQSNMEALERLWLSAELSRRYEDSVELHLEIIESEPYNQQAWYNLGHGYNCILEYEKGIEALEYALIIDPNFESAYLDCADTCMQIKEYKKALELYSEANDKFGPNDELMVNIAQCYVYLKNFNLAKQWLLKALKIDQMNDEAYYLLGECYALEEVWYNAINAYHKAIKIENRREEYYLGLAKSYHSIEDYQRAELYFHLAAQTGPEEPIYWVEYISFLIKNSYFEKALAIIDEAEDNSFSSEFLLCRAIIEFRQKNKKFAYELIEEALEEDPFCTKILFDLMPELSLDKKLNSMIKYFAEV